MRLKKILFLLGFLFVSLTSFSQIQYYQTKSYAFANVYSGRYVWGDWQSSNMRITINLNTDVITVYSPQIQVYKVIGSYNNGNAYSDSDGGRNVKFYVIDQDGDKGNVRLRIERNGNSQIYIDFNDCAWVYNVYRTS